MTDTIEETVGAQQRPHRFSALPRLVDVPPQQFLDEVWSRRPLLSPAGDGDRARFADLFSTTAVDELASERGLRTPFLRMAKEGSVLAPARFTRGGGTGAGIADQAADDKILGLLADGATLVLQGLHRTWPPIVRLTSELAAELGHPIQVNAYITPAQNQGFASHYDTHDVFVLQIAGRKRWRIHEPVLESPLPEQPWEQLKTQVAERAAGEPLIDAELAPGDALYLPRGYLHSAVAQGELSIHLTIGVHPITRATIVDELLREARLDEALRTSLPAGVDLGDPDELAEHVRATLTALTDLLARDTESVTQHLARRIGTNLMSQTRPEPVGPLAQAELMRDLTEDTALRLRAGLRARPRIDADGVALVLLDRTVTLPAGSGSALEQVLGGEPLAPADLDVPDGVDRLDLARLLVRAAVLVPA